MANNNHLKNNFNEFSYRYINGKLELTKNKWHKDDEIVNAMYAMYCLPRSLEYIGRKYGLKRQKVYSLLKEWGYNLRSKKMIGLQILDGIKFTQNKNNKYLRGTVNGKRMFMHQYVWKKYHGEIPEKHCIYHKDKDKSNNNIDNLIMLHITEMSWQFDIKKHKNK